ncbi:DUF1294 domain-containing protein [Neobacillus dielmonensis]|uniref:DUF1294 domain-containing protein n=1 Tax=Neobacillus dielmonensis TaxID=1347369 RepID=UPI0005A5F977|nr:DUF1294 domain-containing protein [Neobacillus dielmonensis]
MDGRTYLVLFFAVMNLIGIIIMGVDKQRAKRHQFRISERTLWLVAIFGGAIGSTAGMRYFHHKTKHVQFKWGFPILALVELVIYLKIFF